MDKQTPTPLTHWLALNRTVGVVLLSVLLFGLGEELWSSYMPEYLHQQNRQAVGADLLGVTLWTVGIYTCLRNFFEGLCYLSGGQLTAWIGDRGSLFLFGTLTVAGYVLFLAVPTTWAAVIAALLILGWEPLSVPVTFTTVGSTVTKERQGMAFAIQSIQKRLPKILGPLLGALVLGAAERMLGSQMEGRLEGMRLLVGFAFLLGVTSLVVQWLWMPHRKVVALPLSNAEILRRMPPALRRLWCAEFFTRWCDWLVRDFVVLYLLIVWQLPIELVGTLVAVQNTTALLTYLPIGGLTKTHGLRPFIGVTFVFFALFPLALVLAASVPWLFVAFVVYGLREIGEPARKALITTSLPEEIRARGVGLYWGLRCFATCWASLVGAWLWGTFGASVLLFVAFGCGVVGSAVFYLGVWLGKGVVVD